ncbi:MAG: hypothetical protein HZC28_01205 [Spirochaetes bacterium]|nr:hypothetical protein [Spirochaetota bacterium]
MCIPLLPGLSFETVLDRYRDVLINNESDAEERLRELERLFDEPANINTAPFDILVDIPFISAAAAAEIIRLRTVKPFTATYELIDANIITEDAYEIVRLFITVHERDFKMPLRVFLATTAAAALRSTNNAHAMIAQDYFTGLARQCASGNPFAITHRLGISVPGILEMNALIGHDARERDYADTIKMSIFATPAGPVRTVGAGALTLSFGQKLLFATGYASSPGDSAPVKYEKQHRIQPDRGGAETFFNGMVVATAPAPITLSCFAGLFQSDAKVLSGYYDTPVEHVRSMEEYPPLHDSGSACSNRNMQVETIAGGTIDFYAGMTRRIGITAVYARFQYPVIPAPAAYNRFDFSGNAYGGISLHGNWSMDPFTLFGEFAVPIIPEGEHPWVTGAALTAAPGFLGGIVFDKRKFSWMTSVRYYHERMPVFHNKAFSSAEPRGEYGLYNAVDWNIARGLSLRWYLDMYQKLWPGYGEDTPDGKALSAVALSYSPFHEMTIQIRERVAVSDTATIVSSSDTAVSAAYENNLVLMKVKGIYSLGVDADTTHGYVAIAQVTVLPPSWISVSGEYMYFDARGRTIYTAEKDIPGEYASAALSGYGMLGLVTLRVKLFTAVEVNLKYRMKAVYDSGSMLTDETLKARIALSW